MNGISPWAAGAGQVFKDMSLESLYSKNCGNFNFNVFATNDTLYLYAQWPAGGRIAFRMAYSPDGTLAVNSIKEEGGAVHFKLQSVIGDITVVLSFPEKEEGTIRYTTKLTPRTDLYIPFWPRDIIITGKDGAPQNTAGKINVSQVGTRSGAVYFSMTRPKAGSVLYLQNLTALSGYCEQTGTSAGNVVGGQWPELGLALPPAIDKPIAGGTEITISDPVIVLSTTVPDDEAGMVRQYLDMLAKAYVQLPRPDTAYHDWPTALNNGLRDLLHSPGCWSQVKGKHYFNAYVCDHNTPPEIMVQLAVLLPLLDYVEWHKSKLDVIERIKEGLPEFYDKKLKTIVRWLPAAQDKLEGEEEQKMPDVMDSWYLHHPLLNLSRLALKGDKVAEQLFLNSVGYAIKVAHHFKYEWPVFYNIETLEIIKAETEPGKGGEKDVPGLYAHIMLQAYELTGEKRYLNEAERAAKKLQGLGFGLFYQANNTAFSSGALLRLYKITGNTLYLELSYLCLANIFKNVQLWDCNYGYGKNFPSFFALFPLSNAPYTAVYEEQEVFCALHDYLKHAEGVDILPSVSLLIAEYVRYLVFRAIYYYPPMLPKEMLKDKPKIGEVDPGLWIALEDLHDGWEQSGQVGQEVYGAGNAFGILPRHYLEVSDEDFMVFVDYPTANFNYRKGTPISFRVLGNNFLQCRLVIVKTNAAKLPEFTVVVKGRGDACEGKAIKGGHLEFALPGDCEVKISWKHAGS